MESTATRSGTGWINPATLTGCGLVLLVLLTYSPVLSAGFVWDDDDHVTANPCIVGPLGLKEVWTTIHARYYPLVTTTFWFEHALWGLAPAPFHAVNVLIHAANAVALWRLLLLLRVRGASLGAALWALHPVCAESVAWVTELKNVQSCLFYILSLTLFARSLLEDGSVFRARWCYGLALLFAALAMASKSSAVVLPLVWCLCSWWLEGRWRWRNLLLAAPVFILALIASILAMWTVDQQGVNGDTEWLRSWPDRLITAGYAVWFYLGKLAWPHPLTFIYPRWTTNAAWLPEYLPLLGALGTLAFVGLRQGPWARACYFAFAYFLIGLLPVLGLIEHFYLRYSFVADHLQYLACMGPLALAGAGLTAFFQWVLPARERPRTILAVGVVAVLACLTWQRAWAFHSQETLWTDTLQKNPGCWLAYNNLAGLLLQTGHPDEAIADFQAALRIKPNLYDTQFNLGNAYMQEGRLDDAVLCYRQTLQLQPAHSSAHINLGVALADQRRFAESISEYRAGLVIDSSIATGHFGLANDLRELNRNDEAIAEYRATLALNPGHARAHNALGQLLATKGDLNGAVQQYVAAVQADPTLASAHFNLANLLLSTHQLPAAVEQYRAALQFEPGAAKTHNNLGIALAQSRRFGEAVIQFEQALQLDPNLTEAQKNLAFAKAASQRTAR